MPDRSAIVERITKETQITVELNRDGQGMGVCCGGLGLGGAFRFCPSRTFRLESQSKRGP